MATFNELVEGLTIFGKYAQFKMHSDAIGADNDEIFIYVSHEVLTPNSEDGKKLQALGFRPHKGRKPNNGKNWSIFVL